MQAHEDRRQQKLELARQWRQSGMEARVFAAEHGVTPWTLYYWRGGVNRPGRPQGTRRGTRPVPPAPGRVGAPDGGAGPRDVVARGEPLRRGARGSPGPRP